MYYFIIFYIIKCDYETGLLLLFSNYILISITKHIREYSQSIDSNNVSRTTIESPFQLSRITLNPIRKGWGYHHEWIHFNFGSRFYSEINRPEATWPAASRHKHQYSSIICRFVSLCKKTRYSLSFLLWYPYELYAVINIDVLYCCINCHNVSLCIIVWKGKIDLLTCTL